MNRIKWILYKLGLRGRWWTKERLRIYEALKLGIQGFIETKDLVDMNEFGCYYFLCHQIQNHTYLTIKDFPELWHRRQCNLSCRSSWFSSDEERLEFLEEAIKIVKKKL